VNGRDAQLRTMASAAREHFSVDASFDGRHRVCRDATMGKEDPFRLGGEAVPKRRRERVIMPSQVIFCSVPRERSVRRCDQKSVAVFSANDQATFLPTQCEAAASGEASRIRDRDSPASAQSSAIAAG
jgi:hypothetical protein